MAGTGGLEPPTIRLTVERSTIELHTDVVKQVGIEPTSQGLRPFECPARCNIYKK